MKVPKWAAWFYVIFGSKLQKAYDEIKSWNLPPEVDVLFDTIWVALSPALKEALWGLVKALYEKYGEDIAKSVLEANLKQLRRWVLI